MKTVFYRSTITKQNLQTEKIQNHSWQRTSYKLRDSQNKTQYTDLLSTNVKIQKLSPAGF